MRLVFSYCEGAYCTQIGNISREELSPRPLGLSVLKILFHEHLLEYGVLVVVLGIGNEPNNVLSGGLLFDQEWIGLFWGDHFGCRRLDGFFLKFPFFFRIPSSLRGFLWTIAA